MDVKALAIFNQSKDLNDSEFECVILQCLLRSSCQHLKFSVTLFSMLDNFHLSNSHISSRQIRCLKHCLCVELCELHSLSLVSISHSSNFEFTYSRSIIQHLRLSYRNYQIRLRGSDQTRACQRNDSAVVCSVPVLEVAWERCAVVDKRCFNISGLGCGSG